MTTWCSAAWWAGSSMTCGCDAATTERSTTPGCAASGSTTCATASGRWRSLCSTGTRSSPTWATSTIRQRSVTCITSRGRGTPSCFTARSPETPCPQLCPEMGTSSATQRNWQTRKPRSRAESVSAARPAKPSTPVRFRSSPSPLERPADAPREVHERQRGRARLALPVPGQPDAPRRRSPSTFSTRVRSSWASRASSGTSAMPVPAATNASTVPLSLLRYSIDPDGDTTITDYRGNTVQGGKLTFDKVINSQQWRSATPCICSRRPACAARATRTGARRSPASRPSGRSTAS